MDDAVFLSCRDACVAPLWTDVAAFEHHARQAAIDAQFQTAALTREQIEAAWNLYRMPDADDSELGLLVIGRSVGPRSIGADIKSGIGADEFHNFGHTPMRAVHCDPRTGAAHADAPLSAYPDAPPSCALLHMGRSDRWTLLANVCLVLAHLRRGAPVYPASELVAENVLRPRRGLTVFACEMALVMAAGYRAVRRTTPAGEHWSLVMVPGEVAVRHEGLDLERAADVIRQAKADPLKLLGELKAFIGDARD